MKKTTLVLAFLLLLPVGFGLTGCKRDPYVEQEDLEEKREVVPGTAAATEVRPGPPGVTPVEARDQDGGQGKSPEEACLDTWLAKKKLDPYGNKEGTMYTGGTPLFDERTGETTSRKAYVYAKHPEAKVACSPAR